MKALQIIARGEALFVELPKPSPQPGQALIRPITLSLCASDIWQWQHAPDNDYPLPPGSSGHEIVGIIEEINGDLPGFEVGDMTLAIHPALLGMAEYFVSNFRDILPVPAGLPPEQIVQAQQLGTVIYACKQLPNIVGQDVAVIGQGSAGLWWNAMLKRLGARRVIGIDLQAHRVKAGLKFGATHTIHNKSADPVPAIKEILNGRLPDLVIEAAGLNDSINLAFEIVKQDGFVLQFGVPHDQSFIVDYYKQFRKCITLKHIVGAASEPEHASTLEALHLISSGEIDVAPVITHHFPFGQVLEAYELQRTRDEGAIKIIIKMPDKL